MWLTTRTVWKPLLDDGERVCILSETRPFYVSCIRLRQTTPVHTVDDVYTEDGNDFIILTDKETKMWSPNDYFLLPDEEQSQNGPKSGKTNRGTGVVLLKPSVLPNSEPPQRRRGTG